MKRRAILVADDEAEFVKAGAVDVFAKPFDAAALAVRVRELAARER